MKEFVNTFNIINTEQLNQELIAIKASYDKSNKSQLENSKSLQEEIITLKNQISDYQSVISKQKIQLEILEKELTVLKNPINYSFNTISPLSTQNTQEDNINFYLTLKLFENSCKTTDSKSISQQFSSFKQEINEMMSKKDKQINELIKANQLLIENNKQLEKKLLEYEERNSAQKICLNCHEAYYPSFNTDKLCIYHPGKLQYYSCKNCGNDEYYTCCNKCSQCLKGCKRSNHIPQSDI